VTDRKPASEDTRGSRFYGSERSPSTAFGVAQVEVGPGAGAWEATAEQKGTSNQVSGAAPRSSINVVSAEQDLEKTDLATFAFGMIAGTLLGLVTLALGNVSIGLGTARGLLIIGYLGSVMPTFGRVPAPARFVLMELGLMLFMAGVGLNAGGGVVDALTSVGPIMIAIGVLITLLPALVAYVVGRQVLGMNPALLLGYITGAMTSTPALNVVTEAAHSSVPALGYAGTYTIANVLLTVAGALMMVLKAHLYAGTRVDLDEGCLGSVQRRRSA